MAMNFVAPLTGRLFVRNLNDGRALVGVLHFDPQVTIEEEKAYVLYLDHQQVLLSPQVIGPALGHEYGLQGVKEALESPIWQKTTDPRALVVRFFKAFPDDNGWTVFGPSSHPSSSDQPCEWWDVGSRGRLTVINEPAPTVGHSISQVLNELPVWPNQEGALHVLSSNPSWSGPLYNRLHHILALAASSPAMLSHVDEMVEACADLKPLASGRHDPEFCKVLHALGHHLNDPSVDPRPGRIYGVNTQEEYAQDMERFKQATRQVFSSERLWTP